MSALVAAITLTSTSTRAHLRRGALAGLPGPEDLLCNSAGISAICEEQGAAGCLFETAARAVVAR